MPHYAPPPRCPDGLLAADLRDWQKLVWLAVRKVQGAGDAAWAEYDHYGALCGKSYEMVRKAVAALREAGWIERLDAAGRSSAPRLRCLDPTAKGGNDVPTFEPAKGGNGVPKGGNPVHTFSPKGGNGVPERWEPCSAPYKEESGQESGAAAADAREGRTAGGAASGEAASGGSASGEATPEAQVSSVDALPPRLQAYADAIADWQAQPPAERDRRTLVALRAGNLPPASLLRALDERRARYGPLALTAALVATDHRATATRTDSRLAYLDTRLQDIADHARRQRLAPTPPPAGDPGRRPRARPRRGATRR